MGKILDLDDESESPQKSGVGHEVTVPSDKYGPIVLRVVTPGDLDFIFQSDLYQLSAHEFSAQLVQHQLISPQLDLESVRFWTDEELLGVVVPWAVQSGLVRDCASEQLISLQAFQDCMRERKADEDARWRKISESLSKQVSDIWRATCIPRWDISFPILNMAEKVTSEFNKLNLDLANLYPKFAVPDIITPSVLEAAKAAADNLSRIVQQNTDMLNAALEAFSTVQKQIAESLTVKFEIGNLLANLPDIPALIRRGEELEQAVEVLRENGFEFTGYLWDAAFVVSMARVDPRVQAAVTTTKLLSVTKSKDFLSELESVLNGSWRLRRRLKIIQPALEAHCHRVYALSVPCLLAQVEGIFTDTLVLKGMAVVKNGKVYVRDVNGKIKKDSKQHDIELRGLHTKIDHCDFREHPVLGLVVDLLLNRLISDRNAVLHGYLVSYGQAKLSTQLALLILVLSREYAAFEAGRL